MRRQDGFTLIELLVVIAIIGILAAIIFPVYAQAKKSAYKSSDLSNMNALRTALQLYRSDNGAYPPTLLGYIGPYTNRSADGNVVPPNAIRDALYPRRVESLAVFRPALDRVADNLGAQPYVAASIEAGTNPMVVSARWPNAIAYGQGGTREAPKQRFKPTDGLVQRASINPASGVCTMVPAYYYRLSGYDVAPTAPNAATYESHYQLFWSGWTVPANPCNVDSATEGGDASDTPRQLGYSEPPEDTVVTWNPFFRDYVNGSPTNTKQDLVLFLGGSARPMSSTTVAASGWMTKP